MALGEYLLSGHPYCELSKVFDHCSTQVISTHCFSVCPWVTPPGKYSWLHPRQIHMSIIHVSGSLINNPIVELTMLQCNP